MNHAAIQEAEATQEAIQEATPEVEATLEIPEALEVEATRDLGPDLVHHLVLAAIRGLRQGPVATLDPALAAAPEASHTPDLPAPMPEITRGHELHPKTVIRPKEPTRGSCLMSLTNGTNTEPNSLYT